MFPFLYPFFSKIFNMQSVFGLAVYVNPYDIKIYIPFLFLL
jgi:hypothetical protein